MFEIGKSAEERRKLRERKKRGVGNTAGRTCARSRKGVLGCISGGGGTLLLAGCILYAFLERGKAHGIIGGLAIISLVLSVNGIRLAVSGFGERDCNYLSCKVGLPVSFVAVAVFLAIFIGGLNG